MLLLFFLSGISGLVYQIVWTRMLVLVFGNTFLATATVLSAFMAGLAGGSYLFGRYIDRQPRPLIKIYAWLEAGIGIYAVAFPFLLAGAEPVYAALHAGLHGNMVLLNLIRFVACFGLIFIPTCFMGATLPVLVKRFVQGAGNLGHQVGFLYGLNTAGAVAGCVAAGFLFLGTLGMWRTTLVAVAINLGVAAVAWMMARGEVTASPPGETAGGETWEKTAAGQLHSVWTIRMVLVGIGLSGFCALAYEVLWTRMLNLFLQNNIFSFTAVLATFLTGIAVGSLIYSWFLSRVRRPIFLFMLLEVGIGLFAYATPYVFKLLNETLFLKRAETFTLAKTAVTMLGPTVLMGIAVPLAMQICQRGPRREGSSVGTVYADNTVGSILGAFEAGFILIPYVGLHVGLIAVAGLNILAGLLAVLPGATPGRRTVWAGAFAAVLPLLFVLAPPTLFRDLYQRAKPTADILYYKEGKVANVVVYDFFKAGYKDLFLNRVEEASSRLWHVQLFKLLGVLPMMVHEEPDEALMVAFGAGMSAGAAIDHATELSVVDLNPDIDGVAEIFTQENRDVINNPKLNRIVNDGRNELLLSPRKYSVIISDATNPKMFDSWTLYTREFYELVKSRLEPGGIFCQWVLIPLPGDAIQVILKTFQTVFPHASFWCIHGSSQCLMLGPPGRLEIDYEALSMESSGFTDYGVESVEKFLSFLFLGEDEMTQALEDFTKIGTDDLPHAQFRVKEGVEGIQSSLDLLKHQGTALPYLTNLGDEAERVAGELENYKSMARHLTLGYLMNDAQQDRVAAEIAVDAGKDRDQNVRFALGDDVERKRYFQRRVAEHPEDANAHNYLGHISWKEGLLDEAAEQFQRALSLNADFANARINLARLYIDMGRYDDAVAELLEVRALDPTRDMLRRVDNELAVVRALRKQNHQGDSPALSLALAEAYRRNGDKVKAAEVTRAAAEKSGNNAQIYLRLAGMYEELELLERALAIFEKLVELNPGNMQIQMKRNELLILKQDPEARQSWRNSREFVPRSADEQEGHLKTCTNALRTWNRHDFDGKIEADKLRQAASLYEDSIAAKADDMHAYADLATLYELLGDYEQAAFTWRRAVEVSQRGVATDAALKRLELLSGLQEGEMDARQESDAFEEIGAILHFGGEFERALDYFRKAAERTPEDGELWQRTGGSHVGAGDYDSAIAAYEQALSLTQDPTRVAQIRKRIAEVRALMASPGGPGPAGSGGGGAAAEAPSS
jgi:spermidine synthase